MLVTTLAVVYHCSLLRNASLCVAVPSYPPKNFQANPTDSRTLLLTWEPPDPQHQNGIIREYIINGTVTEGGEELQWISNTTSLLVDGLHPYYTYNFIIAAVTIASGPFSEVHAVRMPQDGKQLHVCTHYCTIIWQDVYDLLLNTCSTQCASKKCCSRSLQFQCRVCHMGATHTRWTERHHHII